MDFSMLYLPSEWRVVPEIWDAMSKFYNTTAPMQSRWKEAEQRQHLIGCGGFVKNTSSASSTWPTSSLSSNLWSTCPDATSRHQLLPQGQTAISECSSVDKHTLTETHIELKDQQLPGCHAGTPQTPKFLYGVVLKWHPSGGFQYDIGGPQVTSSSPFFSSFHVPLSLPLSNF